MKQHILGIVIGALVIGPIVYISKYHPTWMYNICGTIVCLLSCWFVGYTIISFIEHYKENKTWDKQIAELDKEYHEEMKKLDEM